MCKSFAWYETTPATTWGGEIDTDIGRWFHTTRRRGRLWCHPECGVPGLEPIPGNWWLYQTPTKDAYDERPLARNDTSAKWLYVAVTVLPEHSRWTSYKPQDSESVTKLSATDTNENGLYSRRPARGPILTREHCRTGLDFAIFDHQHGQLRHWRPILFLNQWAPGPFVLPDKCRPIPSRTHHRIGRIRRCWCQHKVHRPVSIPSHVGHKQRHGTWTRLCALTAVRYRDEVLEPVVRPFAGL